MFVSFLFTGECVVSLDGRFLDEGNLMFLYCTQIQIQKLAFKDPLFLRNGYSDQFQLNLECQFTR